MRVERLRVRDFRSYEAAEAHLGEGLTVVHGANGAGKTNLLEALYFGCTARSFRTANERELVRFNAMDFDDLLVLQSGRAKAPVGRRSADRAPARRTAAPTRQRLLTGPARAR